MTFVPWSKNDEPPLTSLVARVDRAVIRWGILWRSENRVDGKREHMMWRDGHPLIFKTRDGARAYIRGHYGYIANRPDLRVEPHGWKVPIPTRVRVILQWGDV